jgi:hypothetical protein
VSDEPGFDVGDYAGLVDNDIVFVPTIDVKDFLARVFYVENRRIILVTGCSVLGAPTEVSDVHGIDIDRLLGSENLVHWFAQNCDAPGDKVSCVPVGLDYHTLARSDSHLGARASAGDQEQLLDAIRAQLPETEDRPLWMYGNFHFSVDRFGDRSSCFWALRDDPRAYFEPRRTARGTSWRRHGDHRFVLSPFGNGIDCHRTWEALVLGSIPIVRRSTLHEMFHDMPAVEVDHWKTVDGSFLRRQCAAMGHHIEKVHLKYWVDLIRSKRKPDAT